MPDYWPDDPREILLPEKDDGIGPVKEPSIVKDLPVIEVMVSRHNLSLICRALAMQITTLENLRQDVPGVSERLRELILLRNALLGRLVGPVSYTRRKLGE